MGNTLKNSDNNEILFLYFNDISKYQPLSHDDELQMAQEIKAGDRTALNTLVKSNLRFVVTVAKNYCEQGMDP